MKNEMIPEITVIMRIMIKRWGVISPASCSIAAAAPVRVLDTR